MKKVEIYMAGGFVAPVEESFEEIMYLLDSKDIKPSDYFILTAEGGYRSAYRKRDVVGISEYEEHQTQ
ncbi:MAG: hypothetical protein ACRDBO_14545 [Lachnospiraceae bacterium]